MNRILVVIAMLTATLAFAATGLQMLDTGNSVSFTLSGADKTQPQTIQRTVALPYSEARLMIHSMRIIDYDTAGNVLQTTNQINPQRVELSDCITMREMNAFSVKFHARIENNNIISVVEEVEFEVQGTIPITAPQTVSRFYVSLYEEIADNYATSYLRDLPYQKKSILIYSHSALDTDMNTYIGWKKSLGFDVQMFHVGDDVPVDKIEIQNHIANIYNTAEIKPEFLVLIGDVTTYEIPTFFVWSGSEFDASDLPYTLIEGGDYFPEMLAGRISIESPTDLTTIIGKIYSYESNPYMDDTSWMRRALVVAGNYADTPPIPSTPVLMSRWLYDQLLDFGYNQVDTLFYPYDPMPGTSFIYNHINDGVQFVNYRGWGAAEGWHYPLFHINHLDNLTNGRMLPVVASIVCNTGDYANPNQESCFGEAWMRMGTPSTPNGCIAFFGPSDLHTSTEKNNAICGGFWHGVLYEGMRNLGSAVLRGKVELHNNYPNDQETDGQVEFYFHVYNILSDPTLNMWVHEPHLFAGNLGIPDQVYVGTDHLEIQLPWARDAIATATMDAVSFSYAEADNYTIILPIDALSAGDLTVTVSHPRFKPLVKTVSVIQGNLVGITDYTYNNLHAGETVTLDLTVQNFSATDQFDGLQATINSTSPFVTNGGTFDFGDVAAGVSASGSATFDISADSPHNELIDLTIDFNNGDSSKLQTSAGGIAFSLDGLLPEGNGLMDLNETLNVTFTVNNTGPIDIENATANLLASFGGVTINSVDVNAGTIATEQTVDIIFEINIAENTYVGRQFNFTVVLQDATGRTAYSRIPATIGEIDQTSPTGPDNYGYYVYDSNDVFTQSPVYNWLEIDPDHNGNGTVIIMGDDESVIMDLPFTFNYYGEDFDTITVCSNGWISFNETWMSSFRNWGIPAALGPDAIVAAYWDDLKGQPEDVRFADQRLCYWYDATNEQFIIEYNDFYNQHNGTSLEKFQIILVKSTTAERSEDDIIFQYHTVDNPDTNGNYCTVGITD
ncbi:MAG: hypothetical protein K8S56_05355, partial [Candidatus Cloacimonetes bacterium]|nr:hypothetical protein [Candidatus Cloacimonadota bacterium]